MNMQVPSTRMRVLVVNTAYPPDVLGGAEVSVFELCNGLRLQSFDVRVACLTTTRRESRRPDKGAIRIPSRAFDAYGADRSSISKAIWHLAELARIGTYRRLRQTIRDFNPEIVHFNNLAGFGWLAWFAARDRIRVQTARDYQLVCTSATGMHDGNSCSRSALRCKLLKWPFTVHALQPHALIGVSRHVTQRLERAGVRARMQMLSPLAVYNTPDIDRLERRVANRAIPNRIGFLGRVSPDKGVDILLAAMKLIWNGSGSMSPTLQIAGPASAGYLSEISRKYAEDLQSGRLEIVGEVSPSRFLRSIDVLAVPTQWDEPFGRVAAEAIACGAGIVFSLAGGLPEVATVFGGRSTPVHDFRNPEEWAAALTRAINGSWQTTTDPRAVPSAPAEYARVYGMLREVAPR